MVQKRKSIIVYFRSPKVVKQIAEFGEIKYYTKKGKYAIIYLNADEVKNVSEQLEKLKLVRKVEESLQDDSEYQLDFSVKEKDLTT